MIRQLTLYELTSTFGMVDAKLFLKEGRVWGDVDTLSGELRGEQVFLTKHAAQQGYEDAALEDPLDLFETEYHHRWEDERNED